MSRLIFLGFLLICLFSVYQANPLPQDASEKPASSDVSQLGEKVMETWQHTKDAVSKQVDEMMKNPVVADALQNTKEFFEKAGESIHKELEKINEKMHE